MKQATARHLLELYLRQSKDQDQALQALAGQEPDAELRKIKAMIGRTMASIYLDAM